MQAGECGQPAQAGKRKQHNCGQTGKQNAGRKVPAVRLQSDTYQPPIAARFVNTLSPAFFSYTENKISGMQPLYSRRLRRRPLPYIRHLTGGHRLPTSLIRHLFSRKLFQLCINFSFRLLHFAIQKCIRISKLFICIRLLAIKHSHNLF